jgi:hypothetical protein
MLKYFLLLFGGFSYLYWVLLLVVVLRRLSIMSDHCSVLCQLLAGCIAATRDSTMHVGQSGLKINRQLGVHSKMAMPPRQLPPGIVTKASSEVRE